MRSPRTQRDLDVFFAGKPVGYVPRTQHIADGRARFVNRPIEHPGALSGPACSQSDRLVALCRTQHLPKPRHGKNPSPSLLGDAPCHWCHVKNEQSVSTISRSPPSRTIIPPQRISIGKRAPTPMRFKCWQRHCGTAVAVRPNSIRALPDRRPFHAGTHFPAVHFLQITTAVAQGRSGGKREEFERFAADFTKKHPVVSEEKRTMPPILPASWRARIHSVTPRNP